MLQEMLEIINREGYISRTMLSKELDTPIEVIDEGIEQLLRMGYISEENTSEGCATFCGNCPFANNCSKEIVKTFKITDKSKTLL